MRTMPFGKHKGVPLDELPDDYLEWLFSLDDLREPLRSQIEEEYWWRRDKGTDAGPEDIPPLQAKNFSKEDREIAEKIVAEGVRRLSKIYHPDIGGTHEQMVSLNRAADFLRAQVRNGKT